MGGANSIYIDIAIYILIIVAFIVAIILPYPNFSSKKRKNKKK